MGQGQSVFEIEEECGSLGLALDCRVKFGSNGEVLSMGSRTPGRIEGNSDIAGKGVSSTFTYLIHHFLPHAYSTNRKTPRHLLLSLYLADSLSSSL